MTNVGTQWWREPGATSATIVPVMQDKPDGSFHSSSCRLDRRGRLMTNVGTQWWREPGATSATIVPVMQDKPDGSFHVRVNLDGLDRILTAAGWIQVEAPELPTEPEDPADG